MIDRPFAIFRQFEDRVRVRLYGRADGIASDDALREAEGMAIVGGEHVHGNVTVLVRGDETDRVAGADGIVTAASGVALHTRGADCQIFVIYDPARHAGGTLHAGWRGIVNGAIPAFVEAMRTEFGSDPATLLVGAGPSLCYACGEFTDPVAELPGVDPRFFNGRLADLPSVADEQWTKAGMRPANIERHPDCTKCNVDRWWSLRGGDKAALAQGYRNSLTLSLR
jgi:copper oxidase (laccase) domain-containing protein